MAKHTSTLDMTKDEWLVQRHKGIGSSDIGTILGFNDYKTPYQLYQEKTSVIPVEIAPNAAMEFGLRLEEVVAKKFMDDSGRKVTRDNKIRHAAPPFAWALCNLDRVIAAIDDGKGPGVLEIKTVSSFARKNWKEVIPPAYVAQIQWQLFVTGWKWGVLALLVDGRYYEELLIDRDQNFIDEMVIEAIKFWGAVQENNASIVSRNAKDFDSTMPVVGSTVVASEDQVRMLKRIQEIGSITYGLTKEKDVLTDALKTFTGENAALVDEGGAVIATYSIVHKDAYLVPAKDYRQFTIKLKKERGAKV